MRSKRHVVIRHCKMEIVMKLMRETTTAGGDGESRKHDSRVTGGGFGMISTEPLQ